jgi:hypothetical protein
LQQYVQAVVGVGGDLRHCADDSMSGCGGGDDGGGQATMDTDATSSTGATTSISEERAEELSTSMLLRLSDLPSGWRAQPSEESPGCAGIEETSERYDVLGKAESEDLFHGDATQATSSAGLFSDETTAQDALKYLEEVVQSEEFRDCLNDYLREETEDDVTFRDIQIGQVSFPSFGDRSSAWEVVIPVESEALSVTVYVDAVFILRATAIGVLSFTDFLTPFDEQLRTDLTMVVADRMDEAVNEIP